MGQTGKEIQCFLFGGVYQPSKVATDNKIPISIQHYLEKNQNIKEISLHLDNDIAGREATNALMYLLGKKYEVMDVASPTGKDINDYLVYRMGHKLNKNKVKVK